MPHYLLTERESAEIKALYLYMESIGEGKEKPMTEEQTRVMLMRLLGARDLLKRKEAQPVFGIMLLKAVPENIEEVSLPKGEAFIVERGTPLPKNMWMAGISEYTLANMLAKEQHTLQAESPATELIKKLKEGKRPSQKAVKIIKQEAGLAEDCVYCGWDDMTRMSMLKGAIEHLEATNKSQFEELEKILYAPQKALTPQPALVKSWDKKLPALVEKQSKDIFSSLMSIKRADNKQLQWAFPESGGSQHIICPDISAVLEEFPNFKKLDGYDLLVYCSCFKAWQLYQKRIEAKGEAVDGSAVFTLQELHRLMGRSGNASTEAKAKMRESIRKMSKIVLEATYKWMDNKHILHEWERNELLLSAETLTSFLDDTSILSGIVRLVKCPMLYDYLLERHLLRNFPIELLTNIKANGRKSDRLLSVRMYLINEIISMRSPNGRSKKIRIDTLCDYVGIAPTYAQRTPIWYTKRSQLEKQVEDTLDRWVELGWITSWEKEGKAETKGYVINPTTTKKIGG